MLASSAHQPVFVVLVQVSSRILCRSVFTLLVPHRRWQPATNAVSESAHGPAVAPHPARQHPRSRSVCEPSTSSRSVPLPFPFSIVTFTLDGSHRRLSYSLHAAAVSHCLPASHHIAWTMSTYRDTDTCFCSACRDHYSCHRDFSSRLRCICGDCPLTSSSTRTSQHHITNTEASYLSAACIDICLVLSYTDLPVRSPSCLMRTSHQRSPHLPTRSAAPPSHCGPRWE